MQATLEGIPERYWPLIDWLFTGTVVFAVLWLASVIFIAMRRNASGLTPVQAAKIRPSARPDFLDGDTKKRREALERGDAYERDLDKAEKAENERASRKTRTQLTTFQRLIRVMTLLMSVFSLATMIAGAVFQVTYITGLLEKASAGDRIIELVQKHPIGVTVATVVILYYVVTFFTDKKWKPEEEEA
ncbi:MAG: hypothetical protein Q8R02_09585 [Hyphomonadaceae bacterium]|nr:hypothetical protein [Hyphomonadaceae bacterium]